MPWVFVHAGMLATAHRLRPAVCPYPPRRLKMQRLEDLKSRKAPAPLDYELAAEPPPLAKRRRVMDALQEVQQAGSGGDSEGSEADDGVLDWRAKTL